ncbi:MAG: terpene cyclase/mutase family protein [Thermomicrobiales bacterium]
MRARGRSVIAILGIVLAMMVALLPGARGVLAQASPAASPVASPVSGGGIEAATAWLISQQNDDGSFMGFSGEPDAGTTVDALTALAAAKGAGVDVGDSIDKAIGYLESGDVALVYTQTGVGQAAKLTLGLIAAGVDPNGFASVTPILIVQHGQNAETGIYGGGFYDHALAILALKATGSDIPDSALDAIQQGQATNGGWSFDGSADDANADSNTTAMVLQALAAMGEEKSDLATRGAAYLKTTITTGGASYNAAEGSLPDANSTALAIQGLLAVGEDVSPLSAALATFQNADGSFLYQDSMPGPNLLATVQAIPAQAEVAFPIVPAAAALAA